MKFNLVVFTILLVFNYQAFSIDAPTTGDFELFYPMIHGFVRGAVEWEVTENNSPIPFNTLMDNIMVEVNNTLICIHPNPQVNSVYQQFIGLFAYISLLEPFDIRNISPGTSSADIYNMIINAYSVASGCLTSHPIGPQIASLIQNTSSYNVFEMIYGLSVNHSSAANTYLNLIIPYYFNHTYEEMGYYMFKLVLLAMKAVPYYFPPPSPPLPVPNEAPTTGDFELFYPMIHGFVRGVVEWMVTENNSSIPFNTLMDQIMVQINNTLICIQTNPELNLVYQQFIGLFAYISLLEPFDIRNSSPGTSSADIYNMIINAYSVASACLTSHPIGPLIASLVQNTTSYMAFEMVYGLSVNHSSAANTYLNFIIPYYFNHNYDEMGYYMFKLVLLAMKAVPYYFPPPPPPLPGPNEAPTTGDFELFYPMIHGFVRGLAGWMVNENYSSIPFNSLMDQIMIQVNNTLICIQTNPQLNSVYQQFIGLFAYISLLEPFDIRNISPGTSSADVYNMIINAYSVASGCLTSHPIGIQIASLIQNTTSYMVFEMVYALSVNHSSSANIYLNLIIPYYFNHTYEEMGYNMFKLVLLAMKAVPYYFPPPPPPSPPTPKPTPIPTSFNITIPILNMINGTKVYRIQIVANLSSQSGSSLGSLTFKDYLPKSTQYPKNVDYTITIPYKIKSTTVSYVQLTIYSYSSSNLLLLKSTKAIKVSMPKTF